MITIMIHSGKMFNLLAYQVTVIVTNNYTLIYIFKYVSLIVHLVFPLKLFSEFLMTVTYLLLIHSANSRICFKCMAYLIKNSISELLLYFFTAINFLFFIFFAR